MIGELTPLQQERRANILNAASQHFSDVHFHEADMEKIAREAGVGKGTLYRYFQNKDDLYLKTIEYELESAMEHIHKEAGKEDNPQSYIRRIVSSAVEYFQNNPDSFDIVLLSSAARFKDVVKVVTGIRRKYHTNFAQRLGDAISGGTFREINSEIAMRMLDASVMSLMYDHIKNGNYTTEQIITTIQNLYLNGLMKTKE